MNRRRFVAGWSSWQRSANIGGEQVGVVGDRVEWEISRNDCWVTLWCTKGYGSRMGNILLRARSPIDFFSRNHLRFLWHI